MGSCTVISIVTFFLVATSRGEGGACSLDSFPRCAQGGGMCQNGACVCFDSRYCSHCQYSVLMNSTLPSCVDFSMIGGGTCITGDYGCSSNGECINGAERKFCECTDGWMCPNCDVKIVDFLADPNAQCPEAQVMPFQSGGGACNNSADCSQFQGVCTDGICKCHLDRYCDHCQVDIWSVEKVGCPAREEFGGALCKTFKDCNSPYGDCKDNKCVCGINHICAACQLNFTEYVSNSHECPTTLRTTVPIGGGYCNANEDCQNSLGGICTNNKCECFDGWGCPHCSEALATMEGFECPEAATGSIFGASILSLFVSLLAAL